MLPRNLWRRMGPVRFHILQYTPHRKNYWDTEHSQEHHGAHSAHKQECFASRNWSKVAIWHGGGIFGYLTQSQLH
jgi:hypothetical protein